jgi:hypothetical protein
MAKKSSQGKGLIEIVEKFFASAPALPKNAKEAIVKITPILAIIFGILGILGAIGGLGVLTATSPLMMMGGATGISAYGGGFVASLVWLVSSALLLAAFPGTTARKSNGWNMLFWSEVVNIVGSFVALSFVSGIIGGLIGFYLLFQIKSFYK